MLSDLNLSKNSFVDWTKRGTIPNAKVVSAIAEYLGTTVNVLLGEPENSFLKSPQEPLSDWDMELLSLVHQLPLEAQYEFRGEIKGYLKRFNEESAAADSSKKTGTDSPK